MLPHLDAAYNLARWLLRSDEDARDVVQEAYLRAFRSFEQFHGPDARSWLLTIVRNAGHTWLRRHSSQQRHVSADTPFDEEVHGTDVNAAPDAAARRDASAESLRQGMDQLPVELR